MKRIKKTLAIALTVLVSSSTLFVKTLKAEDLTQAQIGSVRNIPTNKFEFNPSILQYTYNENSTGGIRFVDYRYNIADGVLIPIFTYTNRTTKTYGVATSDPLHNGQVEAADASFVLALAQVKNDGTTTEASQAQADWYSSSVNHIVYSLVDYLKAKGKTISDEDVTISVRVFADAIEEYNTETIDFTITNETGITQQLFEKIQRIEAINKQIATAEYPDDTGIMNQHLISLTATTKAGGEYKMVLGTDNNWYLLSMNEQKTSDPVSNPKTGISNTYITAGIITISALGLIVIANKKNLFKKI